MKHIISALILCALSLSVSAQTVTYSIETTSRPDSFFLVETITQPADGSPRANVQVNYHLMRDTAELTSLQNRLVRDAEEAEKRAVEQARRAQIARAQAAAIQAATRSAFSPSGRLPDEPKPKGKSKKTTIVKDKQKGV